MIDYQFYHSKDAIEFKLCYPRELHDRVLPTLTMSNLNKHESYAIKFNTLKELGSDIQFLKVSLADLPKIIDCTSVLENRRYDYLRSFAEVLNGFIREHIGDFTLAILIVEPVHLTNGLKGVLYGINADVIPVEFTLNEAFNSWLHAIEEETYDKNNGSELKISSIAFRLQNTGGGASISYKGFDSNNPCSMASLNQKTTRFIISNAPAGFDTQTATRERNEFTARYYQPAPNLDSKQSRSLRLNWEEILLRSMESEKLGSEKPDFNRFEKLTGFPFPQELQIIYTTNKLPRLTVHGYQILTFEQILEEWKNLKGIFDTWTLEELTDDTLPDGDRTVGVYLHPHRIPIATDGNGNYYGYDLIPGNSGHSGQIVTFGSDETTNKLVSSSLTELLRLIE